MECLCIHSSSWYQLWTHLGQFYNQFIVHKKTHWNDIVSVSLSGSFLNKDVVQIFIKFMVNVS